MKLEALNLQNNMYSKKLYKRNSNGSIQEWSIETDHDRYRTSYGVRGGIITTTAWTVCVPKNVGKKNETTGSEQAIFEAESLFNKKIEREGYSEKIADVDRPAFTVPMTAKNYQDRQQKLSFKDKIWVNIKYNGVRIIAKKSGLFSRKGTKYISMPHIEKALAPLFEEYPDLILDGEAFNYDLREDLGSLVSLVSKKKPTDEDLKKSEKIVQYWIYDLVDVNLSYDDRYKKLEKLIDFKKPIYKCPRKIVKSHEEIDAYLDKILEDKHEGIMVRTNGVYEHKRSFNLLKYKVFSDAEFEILDIEEGKGNLKNKVGAFIFKNKAGIEFSATPTGSHDYWGKMFLDKDNLIGKIATVKYKDITPVTEHGGGVPNYGKVIAIRDYE